MVNSHKEPRGVGDQCLSYTSESRAHHSPCQGSSRQHVAMLACVPELTHLLQTWAARNPSMQEALGRHISWFLVRRASHNTSHNTSIRRVSARLAMSPPGAASCELLEVVPVTSLRSLQRIQIRRAPTDTPSAPGFGLAVQDSPAHKGIKHCSA